ncbi:hypothetical protein N1F89_11855 [Aquibium sp. A9E412]|uniref:hypothetical protein n=1 Tax=Aquibium sp. A9E412 TaxID=2976767 RepID=UPI0025B150B6|nr:hypothetical protein [Aquibium sp. A9E412]MDN2566920.1 hypothetical protein [Aquibium sp. A9E412]
MADDRRDDPGRHRRATQARNGGMSGEGAPDGLLHAVILIAVVVAAAIALYGWASLDAQSLTITADPSVAPDAVPVSR